MTGAVDPTENFRALFNAGAGDAWFDADNVTLSGGAVFSFNDYMDPSHFLLQATGSAQTAAPVSDGTMGGAKSVTFVPASSQFYASTRAASAWKYLHDGTANEWFCVLGTTTANQTFFSTYTGGAAAAIICRNPTATDDFRVDVFNDTGAFTTNTADTALVSARLVNFSYAEGATPSEVYLRRNGTQVQALNSATAPGVTNPPATLNLARRANGIGYSNMRFRALYFFHRVLSPAERTVVHDFVRAQTGLPIA